MAKYIIILSILMVSGQMVWSWPAQVEFQNDAVGDGSVFHELSIGGDDYDRCDTSPAAYLTDPVKNEPPLECHRWGLVFDMSQSTPVTDWVPGNVKTGYRLPTIKELSRIYDYSSDSLESLVANAFNTKVLLESWFLSSSHRNLDSKYADGDKIQILAMNLLSGEIKAYTPGKHGGDFKLRRCGGFSSDGNCNFPDVGTEKFYTLLVKE